MDKLVFTHGGLNDTFSALNYYLNTLECEPNTVYLNSDHYDLENYFDFKDVKFIFKCKNKENFDIKYLGNGSHTKEHIDSHLHFTNFVK